GKGGGIPMDMVIYNFNVLNLYICCYINAVVSIADAWDKLTKPICGFACPAASYYE
ncbi:MAG: hypothetical protein PWP48_890, partial [Clostridiales bacterium]|nr:hypothetical protein [Clostridiales bacterium]MDK2991657.1 hypothetical protein [Clostridiales bacterium]